MIVRLLLSYAFVSALSVSSFAQHPSHKLDSDDTQTATVSSSPPETKGAPVEIDGRSILLVHSSIGGLSPEAEDSQDSEEKRDQD